jgi:hypothetical protein
MLYATACYLQSVLDDSVNENILSENDTLRGIATLASAGVARTRQPLWLAHPRAGRRPGSGLASDPCNADGSRARGGAFKTAPLFA